MKIFPVKVYNSKNKLKRIISSNEAFANSVFNNLTPYIDTQKLFNSLDGNAPNRPGMPIPTLNRSTEA